MGAEEESASLPAFSPPPIKFGDLELRLQLVDARKGFERLRAGLWDGGEQLAALRGCYIFRSPLEDAFLEVCASAGSIVEACAKALFDGAGCPKAELRSRVAPKAKSSGLVILETLSLTGKLKDGSRGLEFCAAVAKCLAGPLKRVTLAVCHERLAPAAAAAGFGRLGDAWLFWEPGSAKAKAKGKAPSFAETKARVKARLREEAGRPAKRREVALIEGKLTPKTHYSMLFAVEQGMRSLRCDCELFKDGVPGGHYWGCECFPEKLRGDVYKAYVRGMASVLELLGALLHRERLPLPAEIMRLLAPFGPAPGSELGLWLNKHAISHFLSKGGRVDYVLRAVIEEAASFYEERQSAEDDEQDRRHFWEYYGLPDHMLDGDFDFVRSTLIPEAPC